MIVMRSSSEMAERFMGLVGREGAVAVAFFGDGLAEVLCCGVEERKFAVLETAGFLVGRRVKAVERKQWIRQTWELPYMISIKQAAIEELLIMVPEKFDGRWSATIKRRTDRKVKHEPTGSQSYISNNSCPEVSTTKLSSTAEREHSLLLRLTCLLKLP